MYLLHDNSQKANHAKYHPREDSSQIPFQKINNIIYLLDNDKYQLSSNTREITSILKHIINSEDPILHVFHYIAAKKMAAQA
ncbi:hypothetical protein [Chromobacterium sp. ASV23]|uniref:hypothetical protein n=1 Tax=Chromobacterium sp. ASV23 TaxID=2795110 RepID=UPI0018EB209B|nr:hypothetical protein [Chromobacterium sp. ASV23]